MKTLIFDKITLVVN